MRTARHLFVVLPLLVATASAAPPAERPKAPPAKEGTASAPTTTSPATAPPATAPPATAPPATAPPATATPATTPPATIPPATSPPAITPRGTTLPAPPPKSLDELLGTVRPDAARGSGGKPDQPAPAGVPDATSEARSASLKRALTEEEAGEAFQQAVAQMARSATLLEERLDSGLDTQRVQEDVIAKLDLLLKQPSKKGKSSSSSSQQQQREQQKQQVPNQQQAQQQAAERAQQPASDSSPEANAVARREAELAKALEAEGVEWGNLPERVRDMIRQGLRDRTSSLYIRLTEDYYRRLAEESTR